MIWRVEEIHSASATKGVGLPSRRRYVLAIEAEGELDYPPKIREGDELFAGEHEIELSGNQLARFLRAIANVDPISRRFRIAFLERRRVRLRSPDSQQEWRIGPRGGSW